MYMYIYIYIYIYKGSHNFNRKYESVPTMLPSP